MTPDAGKSKNNMSNPQWGGHNKTPGIDGITSEFLKVFSGKIKYFVMEAINCGFHKGSLSTSMRQCIITC